MSALGLREEMRAAWTAARSLDMGNAIVIPCLINSHSHASMTFLRGFADDLPLMKRSTGIFSNRGSSYPGNCQDSSLLGFAEMLRNSLLLTIYLFAEQVLDAACMAGLRCTAGEAVFTFLPSVSTYMEKMQI